MILGRDYQKPFWHGFFHAILVTFYCIFLSIILLSVRSLFNGEIGGVIALTFGLFLFVLSFAVCGFLIFFEPIKKVMHHHFRAAAVMMASTLGWLLVFLMIFLIGLVFSLPEFVR
ncbi:MAG: hypothetical protein KBD00_06255 [Candidatus Peribacteraceae bacterium]|nr:hypothetical protein [Candidatus Peribacteraceae bacterium]